MEFLTAPTEEAEQSARIVKALDHITPVRWEAHESSDECYAGIKSLKFSVMYPVYEDFAPHIAQFVPDEVFFVDSGDLIYKVLVDLMNGDTPMLWGEPGTGKSKAVEKVAEMMKLPFERIHLGETSEPEMLTGHYELKATSTEYLVGRLAFWLPHPALACLEEWNSAPGSVQFLTRPLLDGYGSMSLDSWDGRRLYRHNHFFLASTGNPHWSPRNSGVMPLAEADNDRMSHIVVHWPTPDVEWKILERLVEDKSLNLITPNMIANAIDLWTEMRGQVDRGESMVGGSTRSLMRFVQLLQSHSPLSAFRKVFNRVPKREFERLCGAIVSRSFAPDGTPPSKIQKGLLDKGINPSWVTTSPTDEGVTLTYKVGPAVITDSILRATEDE